MEMTLLIIAAVLGLGGVFTFLKVLNYRRVVSTNEVHIVQNAKHTVSYGKDTGNGNAYYELPSWLPIIGVTKIVLPVSNFNVDLEDYEAYDKGRLPFNVDIKAFFRICDSNVGAQRVSSFTELHSQLKSVVQGAVRTILANSDIEEIMQGRGKFGEDFTKEVNENLANWGVETIRNIELMDIRDSKGSQVIHNIMEKKKSQIEMESRTEVAKNKQMAQIAEIDASREVDTRKQEAQQLVGLRTVEATQKVELAKQTALQNVKEQEKTTKEREMAVTEVAAIRQAEIQAKGQLVLAEQNSKTLLINAEANNKAQLLNAQATLETKKREAEAIQLEGVAKADAEKAMLLAPVEAQTTLAKEIGSNESYQKYLITIRHLESQQAVGIEQAKALEHAEIKVIANTGDVSSGLNNVMDIFTSKGGVAVGSMLEGFGNTDTGKALLEKVTGPLVSRKENSVDFKKLTNI